MRGTMEFDQAQESFERNVGKTPGVYFSCGNTESSLRANRAARKADLSWPPYFYENGQVDMAFRVYLSGYQMAMCITRNKAASARE